MRPLRPNGRGCINFRKRNATCPDCDGGKIRILPEARQEKSFQYVQSVRNVLAGGGIGERKQFGFGETETPTPIRNYQYIDMRECMIQAVWSLLRKFKGVGSL
jgi:hypothetical protein